MDPRFMREAIRLAVEAVEQNLGGPFGAVVVQGEEIVGRGCNRVTSANDPTAHAEIGAIRDACGRLGGFRLDDCQLYTSCEPCPMCLAACYWARLGGVYFAATRAQAAAIGFDDALIYEQVATLHADQRGLPMRQFLGEEARAAFDLWAAKPDKVVY